MLIQMQKQITSPNGRQKHEGNMETDSDKSTFIELNKEKDAMKLVDITSENWEDVIFLTTNETITVKGSREPYEVKGMPSLCEDFVASNALSIVQSVYEDGWVIKAIEHEGELIGFTMFGWNEEEELQSLKAFSR